MTPPHHIHSVVPTAHRAHHLPTPAYQHSHPTQPTATGCISHLQRKSTTIYGHH
jgi:hypothetical protein